MGHPRFDGGDGAADDCGDLVAGATVEICQLHRSAVRRRQVRQRLLEQVLGIDVVREVGCGVRRLAPIIAGDPRGTRWPLVRGCQCLQGLAVRDAEDPCSHGRPAAEEARIRPHDQHHVVDGFPGQVQMPRHPEQQSQQRMVVSGVELPQGVAIGVHDPLDEQQVGGVVGESCPCRAFASPFVHGPLGCSSNGIRVGPRAVYAPSLDFSRDAARAASLLGPSVSVRPFRGSGLRSSRSPRRLDWPRAAPRRPREIYRRGR